MFKPIESFKLDHTDLKPGVYKRYTKDSVSTWDIRFKEPNKGDYLNIEVIHTLEHFLATYFKNVLSDVTYGVFPMGCGTGFYILTKDHVTERTMLLGLLGAHAYINSEEEIPGATPETCGNYASQDLEGAREEINKFYDTVLSDAELDVYKELVKPLDEFIKESLENK